MVKSIELIENGDYNEPCSQDMETQQTHSEVAVEVIEIEDDRADIEDHNDDDADYEEEEEEEEEDDDDDNQEEEEVEENVRNIYLKDIELFDCVICQERAALTVYLVLCHATLFKCENEHVPCHWCYDSYSGKCSACTPSTRIRVNVACHCCCQLLEKIVRSLERSCKYLNYGCGQTFSGVLEADCHEIGCEFAPYSCPIEGCNFSAPSTLPSKHLSDRHGDSVTRFRFSCCLVVPNFVTVHHMEHDIGNMVRVNRIGPYTPIIPFSVELEIEANERVHWDQLSVRYTSKIDSIRSRDAFHQRLSSCPKRGFWQGKRNSS